MSADNEQPEPAPIQILPSELLVHIFSLVTSLDKPNVLDAFVADASGPYTIKVTSRLLPLAAVCKDWRNVAFATPALWSSVSAVRDSYNQEGNAPIHVSRLPPGCPGEHTSLEVYAEVPTLDDTVYKEFFKAHGHQIEELVVRVYDAGYHTMTGDTLLTTVSPRRLKRLVLLGSGILPMTNYTFAERRLFDPAALQLTSLTLHNVPLLPTLHVERCAFLTRFVLAHGYFGSPEALPPVDKVLRILACMPALRETYIEELRFADSSDPSVIPSVVSLPKLRKLRLSSGPAAASLLSRLQLPPSCLVRLETDLLGVGEIQSLVSAVERMTWAPAKVHCVWDGHGWGRGGLQHVSLQVVGPSSDGHGEGGLRVDLYCRTVGGDEDLVQAMRATLSKTPFAGAEEVWLSGTKTGVLLDAVGPVLGEARALHLLNLNSFSTRMAGPLWPPRHAGGDGLDDAEIGGLPRLRTLHVCLRDKHGLSSLAGVLQALAVTGQPIVHLVVSYRLPKDEGLAASDVQEIRTATEAHVQEVTIGEDMYDRHAWWKVVPPDCTALDETHAFWPAWVEGIVQSPSGKLDTLSGRQEVAFGTSD
ncbi:hypothetical protein K466DRAFT_538301 [Polyporus arcularius HHB13444]|uniref:F-box domain-containing protein n=1 Tax=Polyporus arcularius HHB13444 TaxID=1314778 RepID=A0A5C3PZM4_9APHY|nr:hypothetical protein K466DRAFT_538301 [Polyporus arcularius HHB13444]